MNVLEAPSEKLLAAVSRLLAERGIASPDEVAERIRITDNATPAQGARMVARAWTDADFRTRMLASGTLAA